VFVNYVYCSNIVRALSSFVYQLLETMDQNIVVDSLCSLLDIYKEALSNGLPITGF
jgi:hypothetical protein